MSLPAGTFSEGADAASNPFFTLPSGMPAASDLPASLRSTPRRNVDPSAIAVSAMGAVTAAPAASIPGASVPVAVEGLAAATVGAVQESLTLYTAGVLQAAAGDPRPAVGESAFATSLASAVGRSQEVQATPAAVPQAPGSLPVLLGAATGRLGEELGQRILWLSGHNLRSAEIQIDPPELGPLQVQVHTHKHG
jgi:flagellar hook-length control protein FliK